MQIISEYISNSYMSLMPLAGLTVILTANRKTKIEGTQYIWGIMGVVLLLTICEYVEIWCDTYGKDYRILYPKTMLVYWLTPLIPLLEVYLIEPVRHKLLIAIPYIINVILTFADLFGTHIVYGFHEDHSFWSGPLRSLPLVVTGFYVLMLTLNSIHSLSRGSASKGMVVIFMGLSAVLTILAEYELFAVGYTEEIAALDIMIYYFYLAAIHHSEMQTRLHKSEMELERSRYDLMMSQIKPHFINNAMTAVQELCYEEPEKAAELIRHFSHYLRNNIEATSGGKPIPFYKEVEAIREYLALEYADSAKKFRFDFDLRCTSFMLPALTVQPLVENAVKHGIDRYSESSRVVLYSGEAEDAYHIEVRDNGVGFEQNAETLGKGGIGLQNSVERLRIMCGGELKIDRTDGWTIIKITIPKNFGREQNAHDND